MLVKHEQLTEQIIKGFYTVYPCSSVSYFSPPAQIRPRGRGLGAFQRPRLAKNRRLERHVIQTI